MHLTSECDAFDVQTVRKGGLTVRGRGHPRRSVEIVGGLRCDHHHQPEDVQHAVCPAPCLHRRAREHLTVAIPMVIRLCARKFFDCFSRPKHFPWPRVRSPWPTRPREPGEIAQLRAGPAAASALYYAPPLWGGLQLYGTARRCTICPLLTISLDSGRQKTPLESRCS